jgi:hypothetical protein
MLSRVEKYYTLVIIDGDTQWRKTLQMTDMALNVVVELLALLLCNLEVLVSNLNPETCWSS